jgi:hypothetical protein
MVIFSIKENIGARFVREQQVTSTLIKRLGLEDELEGHIGCVNCLEWNEKGRYVRVIMFNNKVFMSLGLFCHFKLI